MNPICGPIAATRERFSPRERRGAAVGRELLVEVADEADLHGLGHELRRPPVEMPVDAILIVGARIDEIVGQPGDHGKFVACLGIGIRVPDTAIDGTVAYFDICQAVCIVGADRNVSGPVDHPGIDPVWFQRSEVCG